MKLYTKRGDDGGTDLFGGKRVAKDSLRVEAYGTVDELNSAVGLAAAACRQAELTPVLRTIQEDLFSLGADLSTPRRAGAPGGAPDAHEKVAGVSRISQAHVDEAEQMIDRACEHLPEMRNFILPGGCELAARLHVARTVCRRAERLCTALAKQEPLGDHLTIYLNRMSDLLFALARRANQLEGVEDVPWKPVR